MLKLKAMEIVPIEYDQRDVSEALALSKPKDDLIATLQAIGQKGEMNAMYHGYAGEVVNMLDHSDPEVVAAACEALGNMGQGAGSCAAQVADQLRSHSSDVRSAAATAIGMLGGVEHAKALAEMMKGDEDEGARCAAIGALGQVGAEEETESLTELLESPSPVVAAAAIQALGEWGAEAQAAGIAKKLDDPQVRYAAICALSKLGDATCELYADAIISKCLQDADSLTRTTAAEALGRIVNVVAQSSDSMTMISELLKHEHAGVRCAAALTFGYMGEKAADQASAVQLLLEDNQQDMSELHLTIGGGSMRPVASSRRPKCAALVALGLMGAKSQAAACAQCLDDDEWEVKVCTLECLAQMGDEGREQIAKIQGCLDDDIYMVRAKACECMGILQAESGFDLLPDLLVDKAPTVRQAALAALAECPETAAGYSEQVFRCMRDPILNVQAAAIACLGVMGETGQCYASILATRLSDIDPGIRAAACEALGKLGDHGAAFADEVAAKLDDEMPEVRMQAAGALGRMGAQGTRFVDLLFELVDDYFEEVSAAANEAILVLTNSGKTPELE